MHQEPEHVRIADAARRALLLEMVHEDWTVEDIDRELQAAREGRLTLVPFLPEPVARECERLARRVRKPFTIAADVITERKAPPAWLALRSVGGAHTIANVKDDKGWPVLRVVHLVQHDQADDRPTPHLPDWPGSSDYHSDPGPVHPRTTASTLVAAPGAPSLRDRAAVA